MATSNNNHDRIHRAGGGADNENLLFLSSSSALEEEDNEETGYNTTTSNDEDEFYTDDDEDDDNINMTESFTRNEDDPGENQSISNELTQDIIPKKDNIRMQTFQCVITLMLFIICGTVVVSAYYFLTEAQEERFDISFHQSVHMASNTLQNRADNIAHEFESISESITSYTLDNNNTNQSWPFGKIPFLDIIGKDLSSSTMTMYIGIAPIINNNNDSLTITTAATNTNTSTNTTEVNSIDKDNSPPLLQIAPIQSSSNRQSIGMNLLSTDNLNSILQSFQSSSSSLNNYSSSISGDGSGSGLYSSSLNKSNSTNSKSNEIKDNFNVKGYPHSYIFQPIYETFADISNNNNQKNNIVGVLFGPLQWEWFLSYIIPEKFDRTYIILENSCGDGNNDGEGGYVATFMIDGNETRFLGPYDFHDTDYDHLSVTIDKLTGLFRRTIVTHDADGNTDETYITATTTATTNKSNTRNNKKNDGAYNDNDECIYTITMYPSKRIELNYKKEQTLAIELFTISMGIAFLVILCVFWSYVRYVNKQNNIIMATAMHTGKIVSSLFPSSVRERIMEDAEKKIQKEKSERGNDMISKTRSKKGASRFVSKKRLMRRYISTTTNTVSGSVSSRSNTSHRRGSTTNIVNRASAKDTGIEVFNRKPIADLFPNCTVLFADIVGFTAWSSVREPTQVFQLLETLFNAFDEAAKKRRVFKVETVGDCYVAVIGLPDPRKDHAVVMAKYADECLTKIKFMVKRLETLLGPGTGELSMRFGMHSGPVTAGVLRGEKSRFQLFGDTVNTAARMESNGAPERIHISQETADLIIASGRSDWIIAREDKIKVKGKGEMQTFWLDLHHNNNNAIIAPKGTKKKKKKKKNTNNGSSSSNNNNILMNNVVTSTVKKVSKPIQDKVLKPIAKPITKSIKFVASHVQGIDFSSHSDKNKFLNEEDQHSVSINDDNKLDDVKNRLVDWSVELLIVLLKKVIAQRLLKQSTNDTNIKDTGSGGDNENNSSNNVVQEMDQIRYNNTEQISYNNTNLLEESNGVIILAPFHPITARYLEKSESVVLDDEVKSQLLDYVTTIATLYNDNEFHNFSRASHIMMAVMKSLSRIQSGRNDDGDDGSGHDDSSIIQDPNLDLIAEKAYRRTYGIGTDTIVQFALVFSALIIEVDHNGVSNEQLVKEKAKIANLYHNQSVLQQNSFDLAWSILMDSRYKALRNVIYQTKDEYIRFRQTVVHAVMSNDVDDKVLQLERNHKWNDAFVRPRANNMQYLTNLRATLVIEYLIQAATFSHTIQHWTVYRKWTEKYFKEVMYAYQNGRSPLLHDPKIYWFLQEIKIFDNCVIPLANKLKVCGIFGRYYGCAFLECAIQNRSEWEYKGRNIVEDMAIKSNSDNENNNGSFHNSVSSFTMDY